MSTQFLFLLAIHYQVEGNENTIQHQKCSPHTSQLSILTFDELHSNEEFTFLKISLCKSQYAS